MSPVTGQSPRGGPEESPDQERCGGPESGSGSASGSTSTVGRVVELVTGPAGLSEAQLSALCTEVWPVLALIGGVDSGLRAGGVCLHKPSGRRATLLGVLKEGSPLAKLQWEEADLTVRYPHTTNTHTQTDNLVWFCFVYNACMLPIRKCDLFVNICSSYQMCCSDQSTQSFAVTDLYYR